MAAMQGDNVAVTQRRDRDERMHMMEKGKENEQVSSEKGGVRE